MMKNNCFRQNKSKNITGAKRTLIRSFALAACLFCAVAHVHGQNIKPLRYTDVSVEYVLNNIEKSSDYVFLFNDRTIDKNRKISVKSDSGKLSEILEQIFEGTNVSYTIVDKQIILSVKNSSGGVLPFNLKGHVADPGGNPLSGVGVRIKGAKTGSYTDLDGNFIINLKEGDILIFSCIGFEEKEVKISGKSPITVTMQDDFQYLNSVVVTALGIKREQKTLSYNIQEIKGEILTSVKETNFINSLDGKVAGVTINRSGSGVGGATRVVMRGTKSIEGNNNVLYVIDGMPIYNTSVGETSGIKGESRVGSEGIADFNPEDVESVSVLSGPSAAALYGSSAANGVILITTKKGKSGQARIDITSSFEFSRPFVTPRFQNTYGNKQDSFESWGDKLETPSSYDPVKDFFITGTNLMNSAVMTFGTEKNRTYLSLGATNAGGIVPNNKYKRYNFNFSNTSKFLEDKMELTVGIQYIRQEDRNMVSQGEYWNPVVAAYLFPRGENWTAIKTFERMNPERNIPVQYWPVSESTFGVQNPYWTAYRNISENKKDRYVLSSNIDYKIFEGMNVVCRLRFDKSGTYFHRDLYASTDEKWAQPKGYFEYSNTYDRQIYGDIMMNFQKKISDFSLNVNAGTSFFDYMSDMSGYGGHLHLVPNMFTIGNINPAFGTPIEGGGDMSVRNIAIFGSMELGWKNMIYLTATGRNDWNSRLVNSAEPYFFYPSVGMSFLLSELIGMKSYIDLLKLRVSYTQVGAPVSRSGLTPGTHTNKIVGGNLAPDTVYPYGEFKAERTKSYEFGMNFRGLYGLYFDFTFYKSNTYNQTFLGKMPESSGYKEIYLQAGNVQNTGIEAAFGYDRTWNDFRLATGFVFSSNKNEIKEMVKNYKHPDFPELFDIDEVSKDGGRTILKVGGSINDVYANKFLTKDQNGYIYIPETGEISTSVGPSVYLGKTSPDFNLSWTNNLSWKGLSLGFMFSGRFGGIVTSSTQAIMDRFGVSKASADARDNGGVMIPGQGKYDAERYYALTGASGESELMGYYTYDATNIRLKQLTLTYRFPEKLFRGKIRGLSLSLIGNNLWMIYNKAPYDPELTSSTGTYGIGNDYFMQPSLRSFGASIKLSL